MTTKVLFMCPHSAGKSLLAATYFRAAAARAGLPVEIEVAGPDPDPENIPRVRDALLAQGYTIGWEPKRVSEAHTEQADLIVSVGCSADDIPTQKRLTQWEVPMLMDDFTGAVNAIHERAEALARTLTDKPVPGGL